MQSDMDIASRVTMRHVSKIAKEWDIDPQQLELYGDYKAKIKPAALDASQPRGKLILVTAMNPTPAGEGKTTTTIGLGQALCLLGKKAIVTLREPSLGPVMGIKGGAAGGGFSQVIPMEDINLHFTGDIHAVTAANNLIAAMVDNHIHQGNIRSIRQDRIVWQRVMDMNDRALRQVVVGLGKGNGLPREDGFMITAASEVMAVLCLSNDLEDLKVRIARMIVAYDTNGTPITVKDIGVDGAVAMLLKDAIKPNLVQTIEHTPALMHGGPFANIAHGCNSVIATRTALCKSQFAITEAGFGADLGAEKFFHIKCRAAGLEPQAAVLVATIRALKYHGGVDKAQLAKEDVEAVQRGFCNLDKHIENIRAFGVPALVAVNRFETDTKAEMEAVCEACEKVGVQAVPSDVYQKGGQGGIALAEALLALLQKQKSNFAPLYSLERSISQKIECIAHRIYGAKGVEFSRQAERQLERIEALGLSDLPICIAKTPASLSDDPVRRGRPEGFDITVRELSVSAGAGFIVALTADVMTMPGLSKNPAAQRMRIGEDGKIEGLF